MKAISTKKRTFRLKWKLFAYFIAFILVTLFIVWLLQIVFLNRFYQNTRIRQVYDIAERVSKDIKNDNLRSTAIACATDYNACIRIFLIDDNRATELASVEGAGACFIHYMNYDEISLMYDKALNNGGDYLQTFEFNPYSSGESDASNEENDNSTVSDSDILYAEDHYSSAVLLRAITTDTENSYAIMVNVDLLPVRSIVQTLKTQFIWITVMMSVAALLLAVIASKNIARPVARMNKTAKMLARGQYDVKFEESSCTELAELATTLNATASELSRIDVLQKELIANISHDLRTPLTMICGYCEVMRDIPGENNAENIQVVIDEALRLSGLVTDLLDISRLQSGVVPLKLVRFDLTGTIHEIMQRYDKIITHEGYHISFSFDESIEVIADRTMIMQVVYNLINNAINYCGVDKAISVRQSVTGELVRITVSDNGIGISPENIAHIWDRYYKTDKPHKRATIGTGLGLSMVKQILEQHGAPYGVQSTPGVGSAFWFELKIADSN